MIGAYLLVGLLALVVVAAVAWPIVSGRVAPADEDRAAVDRRELDAQIELSLKAIREIEFDHRAGNLSDADFAELYAAERANAARLLRQRDGASEEAPTHDGDSAPVGRDAQVQPPSGRS